MLVYLWAIWILAGVLMYGTDEVQRKSLYELKNMLAIPFYCLAYLQIVWSLVGNDPYPHLAIAFLCLGIGFLVTTPDRFTHAYNGGKYAMKIFLKLLVQVLLLILLTPSFLFGFLVGIVFHPVQAGFQSFKPFAEYILSLRKERK